MKILKYLLALIILLALLFFLKGIMTPSIGYKSEVIVDKPAAEAWAVMSDIDKMPKWLKGFKRTEHVSGTPNTAGAVSNIYIEENGKEMVMRETINKIVDEELLDMTFSMDFMDMDYKMSLSESGGKTTISSQSTTTGNGALAKSIVSFMTSAMKKQEDENLNSLKKLIEENTDNYFEQVVIEMKEATTVD